LQWEVDAAAMPTNPAEPNFTHETFKSAINSDVDHSKSSFINLQIFKKSRT
jgi:hypothetical protein